MLLEAAIAELPSRGKIRIGSHTSTTTMTLFQDDHDLVRKMLRKDTSNISTTPRQLAYTSPTTMHVATGPVLYQNCKEIDPGKPKIAVEKDDEGYKPPISLAPIRIPNSFNHSPSYSVARSPASSTNKLTINKNTLKNAKRPDSPINSSPQRSPTFNTSSPKGRKSMPLPCYATLPSLNDQQSSTPIASESSFNSEEFTPSRLSNTLVVRSPMLYSPYTHSPYYFSPLSNTSSYNFNATGSNVTSPRASIHSDASRASVVSSNQSHLHASDSDPYSTIDPNPHDGHGASPHSPLCIASFFDAEDPLQDNGSGNDGGDSLSFASPEMEILDEGKTTNLHSASRAGRSTMAEFISRGGPGMMHRSLSTSRVTFAKDHHRKPILKKYYSAQLSGMAHANGGTDSVPMHDTTCSTLHELFPLKRPNGFKQAPVNVVANQHTAEKAFAHMDRLGILNDDAVGDGKSTLSKLNVITTLERPAEEVVIQGNDEEGFAYSPVASAFVFSPRRTHQNSYFMRSASTASVHYKGSNLGVRDNSIKRTCSLHPELIAEKEINIGLDQRHVRPLTKANSLQGSPKISSVLLRFAEAQERLYNSAPASPHHLPSAPATPCLPVCSFLGRTFLCRSKLAMSGACEE